MKKILGFTLLLLPFLAIIDIGMLVEGLIYTFITLAIIALVAGCVFIGMELICDE